MKGSGTENLRICGNILSSKNYDYFILRCGEEHCEEEFELWTLFICHLQKAHSSCMSLAKGKEYRANPTAKETKGNVENEAVSYFHKHFIKEEENLVDCTNTEVETEIKIENPIVEDHINIDNSIYSFDEHENGSTAKIELKKDAGQNEGKWFCFNLQEASFKKPSLAFLKLLKKQRALWDSKNLGSPCERAKALKEIKEKMKKLGWAATEANLRRTASRILRQCQQAKQNLAKYEKIDKEAQDLYELCAFLYEEDTDNAEELSEVASKSGESGNDTDSNSLHAEEGLETHATFSSSTQTNLQLKKDSDDDVQADSDVSSAWNSQARGTTRSDDSIAGQNKNTNVNRSSGESNNDTDSNESYSESSQTANNATLTGALSSTKTKQKQRFKRILFSSPNNKISLELITLLRDNPMLWDTNHKYFNNLTDRKAVISSWIPIFKERYDTEFSYDDLSFNLTNLRRYYGKVRKRKHLDDAAKLIIDRCNFLPHEVRLRIICEHCGKLSTTAHTHRAHLYMAHKIGDCPYKCGQCGKEFNNASQLNVHNRVRHTKQLKYECSQCDLRFVARCLLDSHMQVHLDIKNYICETCGKRFRRNDNLLKHETRIHLRQRNFACTMCPKAFYTKALLRDHTNVHLDIRNYKCPTCEKAFHSAHSLMRHKQIHAPVKKYACKLCDARFAQFVGLNTHMKHRHNAVSTSVGKISG